MYVQSIVLGNNVYQLSQIGSSKERMPGWTPPLFRFHNFKHIQHFKSSNNELLQGF
jgi:hypothetical protein